ncbi:uncharacterized protein LOC129333178 isoform X2 [Eublepharis macularius]|uniref:RING-type E3 ubiquitin transferase n=1 Tax=Eublepharis macularius TaxID=481883 RepID=A0AA97JMH7_EUBMA|nr:uncharacterized protein LOC129333178 isoform X2 [Eublepharis macularius]
MQLFAESLGTRSERKNSFSRASATPSSRDICSSSAVCYECCHHSPVQSAVVLKSPVCQNSLSPGTPVTVIFQDPAQAPKRHLHGQDWVLAVKCNHGETTRSLKFSKSLNDMDQSTVGSFSYADQTCPEDKLTLNQEPYLRLTKCYPMEKKPLSFRPFSLNRARPSYFQSLTTLYLSPSGASDTQSAVNIPLLDDKRDHEMFRSVKLLRYLFSFSRNSSAGGHELENHSGHLRSEKSSSVLIESAGFCSDDMGDDDVFEEGASGRLEACELRAPLCSVEKDSDLDCPSPLSEKCPPLSPVSVSGDACRICHCEGDEESPLITPCRCTGSLHFVHQACLQQWIKSSDTRCCELCKYEFIMETKMKPLRKWEKLQMTASEQRKIMCSVTFHVIAITCVVWSLYVLIDRTAEEIKHGQSTGILEWPFWTKLVVVAIGFTGGLLFMYIQCKVYIQLWKRLKAYNRVIYVQNYPESNKKSTFEKSAITEPNTENKDVLGCHHAETNGSYYTEHEDYRTDVFHV